MPSAHATSMVFFLTMVSIYRGQVDAYVIFAAVLTVLVLVQRKISGCHSAAQLFAGCVLGWVIGVGYGLLLVHA